MPPPGRQASSPTRSPRIPRAARTLPAICGTVRIRWSNLVLLAAFPAFPVALAPLCAAWHWTIDLLACFPVQACGWLLGCALLLAIDRRFRVATLVLAFAAIAAAVVAPGLLRKAPTGDPDGKEVRVLSLNLLRGNEHNLADALAAVRTADPDVVFCSEVTPAWLRGLDSSLSQFPHRIARADAGWFGVALYSKFPLHEAAVVPLAFDWAPAVRAVVRTPHGEFGLLGVHTPRPGNRERNAERDRALAAIPAALRGLPPHQLVLGDCNATPWSPAFRELLRATGLGDAGDGAWAPTWPSQFPLPLRIRIDHALVTASLGVAAFTVGDSFGSDHLPIAVTLRLPR